MSDNSPVVTQKKPLSTPRRSERLRQKTVRRNAEENLDTLLSKGSDLQHETILSLEREKQRKLRASISLLKAPIVSFTILLYILYENVQVFGRWTQKHASTVFGILFIVAVVIYVYFIEGAHQQIIDEIEEFAEICTWWIGLGILSSVGLGTGLHTFVLYLGPFIMKTTLAADTCDNMNFNTYGKQKFICLDSTYEEEITMWKILSKIQFEAILWGVGTAIGELPPYFVARAARLAESKLKENSTSNTGNSEVIEMIEEDNSWASRAKLFVESVLNKLGFWGILLFASIPNPLFDLAGLTCGHCLIPFATFFGATLIGKAFFKVHIQSLTVITVFSKEHLAVLVDIIEFLSPIEEASIRHWLENEKQRFKLPAGAAAPESKPLLGMVWDLFLILMITYFLISILDSTVQSYLVDEHEKKIQTMMEEQQNTK